MGKVVDLLYEKIKPNTVMPKNKLNIIEEICEKYCSELDGDVVELGVYKGGSSILLAALYPESTIYLLDTFTGIPNAKDNKDLDLHKNGDFDNVRVSEVLALHSANQNVIILDGHFPKVKEHIDILNDKKFIFAHFDGDTYQSCEDFISFFFPRMVGGGVMLFDDYNWQDTPGVKKSVDNFIQTHRVNGIDFIGSYQYAVVV